MKSKIIAGLLGIMVMTAVTACGKKTETTEVSQMEVTSEAQGESDGETPRDTQTAEVDTTDVTLEDETSKAPQGTEGMKVILENVTVDDTSQAENGEEVYNYYYSSYQVKTPGQESVGEKMTCFFEEDKEEFLQQVKGREDEAKMQYEAFKKEQEFLENDQEEYFLSYGDSVSWDNTATGVNAISFKGYRWSYDGTQSKNECETYSFALGTGEVLGLKDIFEDESKGKEEVKQILRAQLESEYYKDRVLDDVINRLDQVVCDGRWYLGEDGLHLFTDSTMLLTDELSNVEFIVSYEELSQLKPSYIQGLDYAVTAMIGCPLQIDLDYDGTREEVCYYAKMDEDGNNEVTLTINGKNFTEKFLNVSDTVKEVMYEGMYDTYSVVDIDKNDKYKEIVLTAGGMNGYYISYLLHYDKGELEYVGSLHCSPNSGDMILDGAGTVKAHEPANLLESFRVEKSYQVENGKLCAQGGMYPYIIPVDMEEYVQHNILQNVTVYTEPDKNSQTVELTAKDGPVSFTVTDAEHFVELKTKEGKCYYLYMKDFGTIESNGIEIYATDVFENLFLAG